jgi:hypothetical protein
MTEKIGEKFLEMSDLFKGYIQYVNNYNSAMERLDKLTNQNPQFKAFIEVIFVIFSRLICCLGNLFETRM